ncbi:MAG: uroporphyrinogen-III synthase [Pseudomonadota bacterium]
MTQAAAPLCLLTRPRDDAERFAVKVRQRFGVKSIVSPLLKIVPIRPALNLADFDVVILTSVQAARQLSDLEIPKTVTCFAVGRSTADTARGLGFQAHDAQGDVEALFELVRSVSPKGNLIHLRGEHSRGRLAERLTEAGLPCEETVVYQQIAQALSTTAIEALAGDTIVVLPLFSPRTARILAGTSVSFRSTYGVAMSAAVADELTSLSIMDMRIATAPNQAAMLEAMGELEPIRSLLERRSMQS